MNIMEENLYRLWD